MPFLREVAGTVELTLKIVPGASRDRIVGPLGDALKIQVAAAPEKGRANDAIRALLARALDVPPRRIEIVRGHAQPRKTVRVSGVSVDAVRARLLRVGS